MRVDHVLPSITPHDAISNHVLEAHRVLGEAGHESRIYAEHIHPAVADRVFHHAFCPSLDPGQRVLLYQASTDSGLVPWLVDRARHGELLVSNYHNITPAVFADRWEPETAAAMRRARRELSVLRPDVAGALAVSDFNRTELEGLGYRNVKTSPLLVNLDILREEPAPKVLDRLWTESDGATRWLFVGRIAPNKCQHDVIAAFAVYRQLVDPAARLALVGFESSPRYATRLRRLARDLGIADGVELTGSVDGPALRAHYRAADVFVCQSEHEGFCVPILEAMSLGVPVVAHPATAVPETVGDGGLLVDGKDPVAVALTVGDLLQGDEIRRRNLVARGRSRAGSFNLPATRSTFLADLEHLADQAA